MEHNELEKKVQRWADEFSAAGDKAARDGIKKTLHQLSFLEQKLYYGYEPSRPPNAGYAQRLAAWLTNLPDEADQRVAMRLAAALFYVGPAELIALHRAAFNGPVRSWLVKVNKLSLRDPTIASKIDDAVAQTWFCPITDSMKISEFMHLNNVKNQIAFRPDWRSLEKFGSKTQLNDYINISQIKQIVLLEDFIATGTQSEKAIHFAAQIRPENPIPVLVVPLILCQKGKKNFDDNHFPKHVTIYPALQLHAEDFVSEKHHENSDEFNAILELAERSYAQVSAGIPRGSKPYGPLGFEETGSLVVLNSNAPDNTLPMIHWKSTSWIPLFPRHSRV